ETRHLESLPWCERRTSRQPTGVDTCRGPRLDYLPQPPPPGVSTRMRSPFFNLAVALPAIVCSFLSTSVITAPPTEAREPPCNPYGGTTRRSESSVTCASVRTSISRIPPSPPRCSPSPPLPRRSP